MFEGLILEVFAESGLSLLSPLIRDGSANERYFAAINVARDENNRQIPSNRKLHAIREQLLAAGATVEFLLRDEVANDIEAGLRATILHAHIDVVRNVFLSTSGREAHIWIEPKLQVDGALISQIKERATHYLADVGLELASIRSTTNQNLPSKLVVLASLRIAAPVTLVGLSEALERAGFDVPSLEWLNRKLDAYRKEGVVVRTEGATYALTLRALQSLGTKKNASSADVTRLLRMANLDK